VSLYHGNTCGGEDHLLNVFHYEDYRRFIKDALDEKSRKNELFSLRAFARATELSPSYLSRTLSGKRRLSATTARQISAALHLSAQESDYFIGLIELESADTPEKKAKLLRRFSAKSKSRPDIVPLDIFRVIADWHHFALLALTNTRGFCAEPAWIARRLGIKASEAKAAIERLLQVGLLEEKGKTLHAKHDANLTTSDDFSSAAIQENHLQHLKKGADALKELSVELREFNNLAVTMNISSMPKAKELIREFIDKFNQEMETRKGEEVFQLNLQFYKLTKNERGQS
jgi:uncharacterized protein (TIGR02147 family)